MVDIVQCYCPLSDKWETQFSLPEALGGIRACTLILPKNFKATQDNQNRSGSTNQMTHQNNSNIDMRTNSVLDNRYDSSFYDSLVI